MADLDYRQLCEQILEAIGGAENVVTMGFCMTRLRFTLKDQSKADDAKARQVKGVKGVAKAGGQYQLIIGSGEVEKYANAMKQIATFENADYSGIGNVKITDLILDVLMGSIAPWLGALMGSLFIQALLSLFSQIGILSAASPTYQFFNTMAGAVTYFMPIFIGFTCAEKIGTNKYIGALIGAILVYPSMMTAIADGTVNIFGLAIRNFTYTGTTIPVILSCVLLKYVEKLAKKIVPQVIYIFGVTMLELIIVVPLTYLIVGPVGNLITSAVTSFILWLSNTAGFLAPAFASLLLPFMVMGGLHVGLFSIIFMMIESVGYDPIIMPAFMVYNVGVAGTALAYALKNKDPEKKSTGFSSALAGVLGISEPSLFGVVFQDKTCMLGTMIGMFIAGAITGIVGYKVTAPISQSIFSIPAAAGLPGNVAAAAISFVATLVCNFVVTYVLLSAREKKQA